MLQVHHKIAVPMFGQPPWERFTDSTPQRARRPWLRPGLAGVYILKIWGWAVSCYRAALARMQHCWTTASHVVHGGKH